MQHTHSYLPDGRGTGSRWQRDKRHRINESTNETRTVPLVTSTPRGLPYLAVSSRHYTIASQVTACMYHIQCDVYASA